MNIITGTTTLYGIIGHPVAHSLSPPMQNAAFAASGVDAVYVPFDVPPLRLGQAVEGLRALGVAGFNVTIPHKEAIIPFVDHLEQSALLAGAVNVVHNLDGRLVGHNTDGSGLLASLAEDLGFMPRYASVVVIGAGGAARGAVAALLGAGVSRVTVVNRSTERARELADCLAGRFPGARLEVLSFCDELAAHLAQCDLLLNTTSLGMKGERIPRIDIALLPSTAGVYDMVYAPVRTPLLREACHCGLAWADGLGMLAAQGEDAFRIWTGQNPPAGVMKSTLKAARERQATA